MRVDKDASVLDVAILHITRGRRSVFALIDVKQVLDQVTLEEN